MNSYELSRNFYDWCFVNPEKVKPIHSAIFFFAIEHCNRLGWKDKFGFPSTMAMEAIGVKNWRTYSSGLNDLVDFGFIKMIEISKNQHSSNIIAIVNFTKAPTKALDKALQKHSTKHSQSTVSIDKQYNKEQYNNNIPSSFNDNVINNNVLMLELINNQNEHSTYIESIYIRKRLKKGSMGKLLKEYNLNLGEQGVNHVKMQEYKKHFSNWLNTMERLGNLSIYQR